MVERLTDCNLKNLSNVAGEKQVDFYMISGRTLCSAKSYLDGAWALVWLCRFGSPEFRILASKYRLRHIRRSGSDDRSPRSHAGRRSKGRIGRRRASLQRRHKSHGE